MIKIMFVCYGNICRSPMAEFIMKDLVKKKGQSDKFLIKSSATSSEELGNPVHRGTRAVLDKMGISYADKVATRLKKEDYYNYDYFIGMDRANIRNMNIILKNDNCGKIYKLMDFTTRKGDVADPWYTGDFTITYNDIYEGCQCLLQYLLSR